VDGALHDQVLSQGGTGDLRCMRRTVPGPGEVSMSAA
jgi:hypothetical protein